MKKISVILFSLILAFCVGIFSGCASCKRGLKSCQSDISGGLNRSVTVYDYQGEVICKIEGFIDIDDNDNGSIMFDCDGKRYVFYNAIVLIKEI